MSEPRITRPFFPEGYVENPKNLLTWQHVQQRLTDSLHYWICSVRPDNRPHAIPRWAVFMNDKIYYDGSPETRHARNIARNPNVVLHLEDGSDVVIVEGTSKEVLNPSPQFGQKLARIYTAKYGDLGYAPEPTQWVEGGLFEITIRMAMAWTTFFKDPTKFVFDVD